MIHRCQTCHTVYEDFDMLRYELLCPNCIKNNTRAGLMNKLMEITEKVINP